MYSVPRVLFPTCQVWWMMLGSVLVVYPVHNDTLVLAWNWTRKSHEKHCKRPVQFIYSCSLGLFTHIFQDFSLALGLHRIAWRLVNYNKTWFMIAAGIWLQQCFWNSPEGYRWHWDHPDYIETQHSMTFVQNLSELYIPSMCSSCTVYPTKYAHGFVVLCFVVVMQPFIMNSYEVFIHIHQGCFAGTGAIVRLP